MLQPKALFLCCLLFVLKANAQRLEVGLMLGASNYVGDLAPTMQLAETHIARGAFGRVNISPSFAFTASYMRTRLSGDDANIDFNKSRNLSFRSTIKEYAGVVEFNFLKYALGVLDKKYTSYVFLGLGWMEYNPETYFEGAWIDLRSLQTENKSYGTTALIIPFGIGFKWKMSNKFALETNIGFRRTYTDYLDDVSTVYVDPQVVAKEKGVKAMLIGDRSAELNNGVPQNKGGYRRGNADFNDWYAVFGCSLSYRIFNTQKCPRFY